MINIEKNYQIAETLVGDLGHDLVHHCLVFLHDKGIDIYKMKPYPDTYFYKIMRQELDQKRGTFFKKYNPVIAQIDDIECVFHDKDPVKVKRILKQLWSEGLSVEVELFELVLKGKPVSTISRETHICRKTLHSCINIVKQETLTRYENSNN